MSPNQRPAMTLKQLRKLIKAAEKTARKTKADPHAFIIVPIDSATAKAGQFRFVNVIDVDDDGDLLFRLTE